MKNTSRSILVICDSLRRDLVGAASPNLVRLAREGTWFAEVHGVFPSTTRVSAACIATGCLPARHGLLGNNMLLGEPAGLRCHNVGHPGFREHLRRATGRTLRVPTLAERLRERGGACIMSNVSAGAAYFSDPDAHGHVFHRAGSYGPGHRPHMGEAALDIASGAAGDAVMTQRFCAMLLGDDAPAMATLWLSEPDHSGHGHALGSPAHLRAIGHADACVAEVMDAVRSLRERGEDVLFMVGSDHGMETVVGEIDVAAALVEAGLKTDPDSTDVVVAPNGSACVLGLSVPARERLGAIAAHLAAQPWCGEVHTGERLAALGLPHEDDTCRLAITLRHDDRPNAHGVAGATWIATDPAEGKTYLGHGQHGGLGRHEQAPFLIVQGGGYPAGAVQTQAVSLIDYAPTILRHLGAPAEGMDGAPLPRPDSFQPADTAV